MGRTTGCGASTSARLVNALLMLCVASALLLFFSGTARAADLTVTTNADAGPGSLRDAIGRANANAEADTITFELPPADRTIVLGSDLVATAAEETVVDGENNEIIVSGNDAVRVFTVQGGAALGLQNLTVANGRAGEGGGIFNAGDLTVNDSNLTGNSATAILGGGGIANRDGGTLTVSDSTFSSNAAPDGSGGGGISNFGATGTVGDSTFSGNTAGSGGGIDNANGSFTVNNSTFTGNTASGSGGAISNGGTLTSTSSTLAGNTANTGSGIESSGGVATVSNTIVANDPADSNCAGTITDGGFNLDSGASCGFTETTSRSNTDPELLPPADNGGPTQTRALRAGSPAIDAGESDQAADQRGVSRPQNGDNAGASVDDIGAFEREPAPGTLQFGSATYQEGEGAGGATITVTRTGGSDGPVSVDYTTANGTATAGQDYTTTTGTLTFADGDTQETFTVPIRDDAPDEPDETVDLALSNPQNGAALREPDGATLTIADNDAVPTISISDARVAEGDGGTTNAVFTVSLSAASDQTVTVGYATADGTAEAPGDYARSAGTVTFRPGETGESVSVPVNGDASDEPNEAFGVNLSDPRNAAISDGAGTGTITDDDAAGISVTPVAGLETTEAGGTDAFRVVLDSRPDSNVTIPLASSDATEGTASPSSLTFTPQNYDAPQTVTVTGVDDEIADGDVAYRVATGRATSGDPDYAGVDADDVSVTNADNDGVPAAAINDVRVAEGDSGTRGAAFVVTLDRRSSQKVQVSYVTRANTAKPDSDYRSASGRLTFEPGEARKVVTVRVNGDTVDEKNETFFVNLRNPAGATVSDVRGVGTIQDNDTDPRPPRCSDGKDNDGDGRSDLRDPGCRGPNDDAEREERGTSFGPDDPRCTIRGTNGPNSLVGTPGRDVICGGGGTDSVYGGGGADLIIGGPSIDVLVGGSGNDRFKADAGDVVIR